MLVLTRKVNEKIIIDTPGGQITIVVIEQKSSGNIRIGIDAPTNYVVDREEVHLAKAAGPNVAPRKRRF